MFNILIRRRRFMTAKKRNISRPPPSFGDLEEKKASVGKRINQSPRPGPKNPSGDWNINYVSGWCARHLILFIHLTDAFNFKLCGSDWIIKFYKHSKRFILASLTVLQLITNKRRHEGGERILYCCRSACERLDCSGELLIRERFSLASRRSPISEWTETRSW